jgi:hypothetical protein
MFFQNRVRASAIVASGNYAGCNKNIAVKAKGGKVEGTKTLDLDKGGSNNPTIVDDL